MSRIVKIYLFNVVNEYCQFTDSHALNGPLADSAIGVTPNEPQRRGRPLNGRLSDDCANESYGFRGIH